MFTPLTHIIHDDIKELSLKNVITVLRSYCSPQDLVDIVEDNQLAGRMDLKVKLLSNLVDFKGVKNEIMGKQLHLDGRSGQRAFSSKFSGSKEVGYHNHINGNKFQDLNGVPSGIGSINLSNPIVNQQQHHHHHQNAANNNNNNKTSTDLVGSKRTNFKRLEVKEILTPSYKKLPNLQCDSLSITPSNTTHGIDAEDKRVFQLLELEERNRYFAIRKEKTTNKLNKNNQIRSHNKNSNSLNLAENHSIDLNNMPANQRALYQRGRKVVNLDQDNSYRAINFPISAQVWEKSIHSENFERSQRENSGDSNNRNNSSNNNNNNRKILNSTAKNPTSSKNNKTSKKSNVPKVKNVKRRRQISSSSEEQEEEDTEEEEEAEESEATEMSDEDYQLPKTRKKVKSTRKMPTSDDEESNDSEDENDYERMKRERDALTRKMAAQRKRVQRANKRKNIEASESKKDVPIKKRKTNNNNKLRTADKKSEKKNNKKLISKAEMQKTVANDLQMSSSSDDDDDEGDDNDDDNSEKTEDDQQSELSETSTVTKNINTKDNKDQNLNNLLTQAKQIIDRPPVPKIRIKIRKSEK